MVLLPALASDTPAPDGRALTTRGSGLGNDSRDDPSDRGRDDLWGKPQVAVRLLAAHEPARLCAGLGQVDQGLQLPLRLVEPELGLEPLDIPLNRVIGREEAHLLHHPNPNNRPRLLPERYEELLGPLESDDLIVIGQDSSQD